MGGRPGATVTALAALALVGWVCATHASDIARAIAAVPPWALAATVVLHAATLALRSEAWRLTLQSAGAPGLSRRAVHGANAVAFVAGAAQSQAALPARVALLRRLAGDAAPRPGQIYVADVPILALELCATALLLAAAVVVVGRGAWWIAPGALAVALAVLAAARLAPQRFARRPLVRGLAVLGDRARRGRLVALLAAVVALTLVRIWLVLDVCDLPHGLGEIAWVFAAMGVFGLAPVGPGASPGATLATLATASVGAAAAAGLLLSASSIVAVLAYAPAVALSTRLRPPARRRRGGPRAARPLAVAGMTPVDVIGSGDPLVLVHGLATTRAIWAHAAPLLARGRQVVTIDVPGFGASAPAGRGFHLEAVAERMHGDLRAAGVDEPFDLVGHSMGAAVALTLAARAPEAVRRLVLVSPAGLRPLPLAACAALGVAAELYVPVRRRAAPLASWGWGRRVLMAGGVRDGAALAPSVVRELVGNSRGARRIGPALSAVTSADLRHTLRALPVPVGALWGSGDRVIPPGGAHTVLGMRPGAACEIIEGAGHIAMVEQPAAFVAALQRVLEASG